MKKASLSSLKVSELKEMCKQKNLKVSGRKADLIERLTSSKTIENASSTTSLDSSRLKSCMGPKVFKEFHIPSNMALLGYVLSFFSHFFKKIKQHKYRDEGKDGAVISGKRKSDGKNCAIKVFKAGKSVSRIRAEMDLQVTAVRPSPIIQSFNSNTQTCSPNWDWHPRSCLPGHRTVHIDVSQWNV